MKRKKKAEFSAHGIFCSLYPKHDWKQLCSSAVHHRAGLGAAWGQRHWGAPGRSGRGKVSWAAPGDSPREPHKLPCLLCRIGLQGRAQNRGSFRAGCDRERSSSPGELCCRLEHCLWAAAAGLLREREPVLLELPECLFVGLVKE